MSVSISPKVNEPTLIAEMLGSPRSGGTASVGLPGDATTRTIAVVGLSDDPRKPSHYVSAYMQRAGYHIVPVNPGLDSVLGERCFASLQDLPLAPDIVNVFRLPRYIPALVEEMISLGLPNLWVQLGIIHPAAARRAESAGISVVMDRCIQVEHARLFGR